VFNAPQRLEGFMEGVGRLSEEIPESINGILAFMEAAEADGALSAKTKELIAIGTIVYHRCEDCMAVHVRKALEAGATRQEILEAGAVGMVFGGGPSLGAMASLLIPALDQHEAELAQARAQDG
jgi:AhpD family alkylhydroperoxidase